MKKENKNSKNIKSRVAVVVTPITNKKTIATTLGKEKRLTDTELLISINRTLTHSDRLDGFNILMFTFLSSELILLTIGDAFGYLKKGLTINILHFMIHISNTNFPLVSLILSAILSITVSALICYFTKPNE
jgi:hypothetical protein